MSDSRRDAQIGAHYDRPGLGEAILRALTAMGKDQEHLTPVDLAPVDEFHARGLTATRELALRAGISSGARVLDVGGGIGGPARILAAEHGARVEVLDLTEEYCRTGEMLSRLLGQDGRVSFRHGNALDLPYSEESFDVVWMQHASMNIEDKERLYHEAYRVLRPGGRLALHEILAGPVQPPHFPVPWAKGSEISFLRTPEATRRMLKEFGYVERIWHEATDESTAWFRERLGPGAPETPPLGIHLVLGNDVRTIFRNVVRNLEEGRIRVVQGVWKRP